MDIYNYYLALYLPKQDISILYYFLDGVDGVKFCQFSYLALFISTDKLSIASLRILVQLNTVFVWL